MAAGQVQQVVVFTRFADTLDDIVRRLRDISARQLIGAYSEEGGRFVDPATREWIGVERDQFKHRFTRGELDIFVCTDAAAEGPNLPSADLLINYDLLWNPMKVEQRIGRIGRKHDKVYVLNLCYAGSAEEIVYGRLLQRLAEAGPLVGTQQLLLLPVIEHELEGLAAGRLSEPELIARAEKKGRARRRPANEAWRFRHRIVRNLRAPRFASAPEAAARDPGRHLGRD
jgi:ERCC4-related helicase